MIISFTGHRKIGGSYNSNPTKDYVANELEKILIELKPDKCVSGVALGFDILAAEICIKLNIPFIAAIPFVGQESRWPPHSQLHYNNILEKALEKVIVCEGGYAVWKMQKRNEYLVNNADIIIACFDGSASGTKNCIDYAIKQNKKIIRIDPNAYTSVVQLDRMDLS